MKLRDERGILERAEVTPRWSSRDSAWGTLRWFVVWLVGTILFYLLMRAMGAI